MYGRLSHIVVGVVDGVGCRSVLDSRLPSPPHSRCKNIIVTQRDMLWLLSGEPRERLGCSFFRTLTGETENTVPQSHGQRGNP